MIGIVIGTRPELIKLRPVACELKALGAPIKLLYTFQHEAIASEVEELALSLSNRRQSYTYSPMLVASGDVRAVIVQGDTDSACRMALSAAYQRIPVAHVEAGLRTVLANADEERILNVGSTPASTAFLTRYSRPVPDRMPHPEEMNRQLISRVASLHLAPTCANERNLVAERVGGRIAITGNPGISALAKVVASQKVGTELEEHIIVTCHRRENWPYMKRLAEELALVGPQADRTIYWIRHPNKALYEGISFDGWTEGVHLLDPLQPPQMVDMLLAARLVVTDSGGLIEEATWLGKRRVCLRTETERPEACAMLTPIEGCHKAILDALELDEPTPGSRYAFGDEKSAANCAREIATFYKELT